MAPPRAERPLLQLIVPAGMAALPGPSAPRADLPMPGSPRQGGADEGNLAVSIAGAAHARSGVTLDRDHLLEVVEAAARNGVDWVQVRDHQASARELFELVRDVLAICRPLGVRVAVNDRLDVALAANADAVQLSERSLPIDAARKIASDLPVGASIHDVAAAIRAEQAGAEWLTFGHVFPTTSHSREPPRGLAELTRVAEAVRISLIAVGGIDAENAPRAIEAGAAGVAVISAILHAADPSKATAELRRALNRPAAR